MKVITRTVLMLSMVSLFTDFASEMLYPVMPIYLRSIGFSIIAIGFLEGMAEALAGISKGYFGELSDQSGKRLPFVRLGYMLSAFSKPLFSLMNFPVWIFMVRSIDRLGKGIRTSARDALLSSETRKENKGKVFGFHRGMDTLGAVLGPLVALGYLYYFPENYRVLFVIAFFPGIVAVTFIYFIKEKPSTIEKIKSVSFFSFTKYFKESPLEYRILVFGLLAFTLFNSSDFFLLLQLKDGGFTDIELIGIYIFYNLVYALTAYPVGAIADKIGMKKVFIGGLMLFAIVYLGMGFAQTRIEFITLFFLYGIFASSTEGVSKAWITNIVPSGKTATAIGSYAAFNSIFSMLASTIAGLLWYNFGATVMFCVAAISVMLISIYLMRIKFIASI